MNKNKISLLLATFFTLSLLIAPAFADNYTREARNQADSEFRIAEKAYRKIVKNYGESFVGLPDEEKVSACKKINSALYNNRHNMIAEDMFRQRYLQKQINKLEKFSKDLDCPPKK